MLLCMAFFIHSFIPAISIAPLHVLYYSEALPTTARIGYCIGVSRRTAQATAGKGLAQGPYVAARARVEPTTIRLKVIVSTKAPQRPTSPSVHPLNVRTEYIYCYFVHSRTFELRDVWAQVLVQAKSLALDSHQM